MDEMILRPWMLRQDWREDARPYLIADFATWPEDEPLHPLPPVPVLGIGPARHVQAAEADVLVEDAIPLPALTRAISTAPQASAVLVQLLRATASLPPAQALTAESLAFALLQGGSEHATWMAARTRTAPQAPGVLHLCREGDQLRLLIDRPATRNAIDRAMRDDLFEAFTLAALDDGIAQVRLRSAGRSFSQGADLAEFGTTRDPVAAHAIRMRTLPALPMIQRADIYDIHIQGGCTGAGLELAAFAGRLTAAPDAWFHLPETAMGILPGFGGTVSLPRRIGRQRAAGLMLSAKRISAQTALAWGLIDAILDEPPADDNSPYQRG